MKETTNTYVELLYPGTFFSEKEVVKVSEREPEKIAKKYPKAFAFKFYDLTSVEVVVDGEKRVVSGKRKNESPTYYPDGDLFNAKQLSQLPGMDILVSNMKGNGWKRVVRTRCGNFQPFETECELL
jgi:hypothetical protein